MFVSHYGIKDGGDANGFSRNINLFSELVKFGYEIEFLTTQKTGFKFPYTKEIRSGVTIIAFPEFFPLRFRKGGISPLSTFIKMCYTLFNKADIVYSDTGHRPNSGWPCYVNRFFHKSLYFSDWWEHYSKGGIYDDLPIPNKLTMGQFDNLFEIKNRTLADGCIVISRTLKKRAIVNRISESNILLLNTGSDVTNIPFFKINSQKEKFGISKDTFVIGIVGINREEINNNKYLVEGVKYLNDLGKKTILLTTGNIGNEVIENSIIADKWVHFEWIPYEKFSVVISCADNFALMQIDNLRNRSRFPNKFGDYLSAGRPIISNLIGDLKYYANEFPECFYVVENEKAFDVLLKAHEEWKNKSVNYEGIRKFAENNSWNNRASLLNDFIKKIKLNKSA